MSFLPTYDVPEEEPQVEEKHEKEEEEDEKKKKKNKKKRNSKKSKGIRDVKFDIEVKGDCDDECQKVRTLIRDTIRKGLVNVPASLTRSSHDLFSVLYHYHKSYIMRLLL